ncbi:MAG: amidohydrolase [Propionibacteriaceae bacterium]
MSTDTAAVLAGLDAIRGDLEDLYRHLHQHPELSHAEHETAGLVSDRLRDLGLVVHAGVGGTGVVGVLRNGPGASVLLRADMDGLPVREESGLPYASTATGRLPDGTETPVMHACGHDIHVTSLIGAAHLLAAARVTWHGTLIVVFQPAEEAGDGARGMVDDGLAALVGAPDIALGQHVLTLPAGTVGTRSGSVFSAADSMRITLYGRGSHGSMPQASVDPAVLAAMIILRLQTIVSRELAPSTPAVVTVGSVHVGSKSNVIGDRAVLELNVRTYDEATRTTVLDAIRRIVRAECAASESPREPEFELYDRFPATINDPDATDRVRETFAATFADRAGELPLQSASEDFSNLPVALGIPYTYWGIGGVDPAAHRAAVEAGRVDQDIPTNHSPYFAPVIQPTLDTGVTTLVTAALAWLADVPSS